MTKKIFNIIKINQTQTLFSVFFDFLFIAIKFTTNVFTESTSFKIFLIFTPSLSAIAEYIFS
jgi:hypothetical protein